MTLFNTRAQGTKVTVYLRVFALSITNNTLNGNAVLFLWLNDLQYEPKLKLEQPDYNVSHMYISKSVRHV